MNDADLRLVPILRLAQGGRWRVEAMRSYSVDQLLWFTRGQGRITAGGVTRGYGAHNAVYIPAGTMHAFEMTSQVFGTALFFPRNHGLHLPDTPRHLRVRDALAQGEITGLLEHLQRESDGDRPARHRAMLHWAGLLGVWLERQILLTEDAMAPSDAARRLARRYSELVERDFGTHKSVSDYAGALHVTPTHLTRVCRETCGRTASDFLADRKIAEARRLLADTDMQVKDIASGLGFASPAYFTRTFQQRAGKSPMAFRRGHVTR